MKNHTNELIVEFGYAYVKMGFSIDLQPRKVSRSNLLKMRLRPKLNEELFLEEVLHQFFDVDMVCSLKNKPIVFIYNYVRYYYYKFGLEDIHNTLAKILFNKFEVSQIHYVLGNVLPLYLTGQFSGIVIDAGHYGTNFAAAYDGFSLLHYGGRIGEGGQEIHHRLSTLIKEKSFELLDDLCKRGKILLKGEVLQGNIKLPLGRTSTATLKEQDFYECFSNTLFGDVENEEPNIVQGFLNILEKIRTYDIIEKISQNIVITGQLAQLPNFIKRFQQEMALLNRFKFKFQISTTVQFPNWVGACQIIQIDAHERFTITKQQFKETPILINRSDAFNLMKA